MINKMIPVSILNKPSASQETIDAYQRWEKNGTILMSDFINIACGTVNPKIPIFPWANESEEDRKDAAIAQQRLLEMKENPQIAISGKELQARLKKLNT